MAKCRHAFRSKIEREGRLGGEEDAGDMEKEQRSSSRVPAIPNP
jgi:hypothetical protein